MTIAGTTPTPTRTTPTTLPGVARDGATATFFDAAARGVLLLPVCPQGHASGPAAQRCERCADPELTPTAASGRARLVTWSVVPGRVPGAPATVLAVGELAEGPWWWSHLLRAPGAELRVDLPLRVAFVHPDAGTEAVPVFVPA